ncbi:hypothetical protein RJ640_017088, partial [Escallonia rubra]
KFRMSQNMFSDINMPSAKTVVSTAASLAASTMVIRSLARDLIPHELQNYVFFSIRNFLKSFSSEAVLIIEEFDGLGGNQIYKAAELYLGTKVSATTQRFKVSMPEKETKISTSMARNQEIVDSFNGVQLKWRKVTRQTKSKRAAYPSFNSTPQTGVRYFELCFHKKHKEMVLNSYFAFVLKASKDVKEEKKTPKIYTLSSEHHRRFSGGGAWSSINLDHPATFETLAMETELKNMIIGDLEMFVKRKEFYKRVGKAWKRGYLLYGPPGTGKSSLIAAMANYLKFDIYDLELTDIHANSELRRLLIGTANRSILVVEDIDCSLQLDDRQETRVLSNILRSTQVVTLSGLLNFIDGLWSSCGDERIIIFTTNHKDRLDSALLRPGRMDVHVHMSYCTPCGFKTLAANYLGLNDHSLFPDVEDLLKKTIVTPADVAEQLLKSEDPEIALGGLIEFLHEKKREHEATEARKLEEEQNGKEPPKKVSPVLIQSNSIQKFRMSQNMFSDINMPSAKTVVSTAASVAASAMVIRSLARDLIPHELQHYVFFSIRNFLKSFSSEAVLIIEEFDGLVGNQIYKAAEIYLGTKVSATTQRFKVSMPEKETKISTSMARNQEIVDSFNGVQLKWRQVTRQIESKRASNPSFNSTPQTEVRYFELCFHKKHKEMVLNSYFAFILKASKDVKEEKKTLKIYTLSSEHHRRYSGGDAWSSINLDHPATFETLAMETEMKNMIIGDLEMFVKRKEFYGRVGKAWKRGYLLYGPPGTGKSSLIAAMANYLKFDIYDLELTDIHANSELRRLLIGTANRSILVVEDIDCSLQLDDRQETRALSNILRSTQVTLSGLLNFIDGLWSSCGDERIIIFTTNHKDRLDSALLRPGRMDVHIHMSYCTPCGFKTLAANYLGLNDHSLFPDIEDLLKKTMVTPADVAEQLLKSEDPEIALGGLIEFLHEKKREREATEARKLEEEQNGKEPKRKEQSTSESTVRSLELRFHRKHKDEVFDDYLTHILKKWKAANKMKKKLRMFTVRLDGYSWESVNFDHPATFDTLAMDLNMKMEIIDDLDRFVQRKKLYRRVGKAWKRGYLLYGPPGTGKSTLIAAMANHLGFDVYDLELTAVRSDSDLRRLLIRTANRSIIVVEDIDCSLALDSPRTAPPRRGRSPPPVKDMGYLCPRLTGYPQFAQISSVQFQITLSGLLNFNDGLWSSCGDERIIVFTTNHKDRLDPALLRPGRMDLHIYMSYCSPCVFKMLAYNYLGITEHSLFLEIEDLIEMMKVTPAEIGELLLKDDEPDIALRVLIEFLKRKKENEEIRANLGSPQVETMAENEAKEAWNAIRDHKPMVPWWQTLLSTLKKSEPNTSVIVITESVAKFSATTDIIVIRNSLLSQEGLRIHQKLPMATKIQIPSTKAVISATASVAATAMLIRSLAKEFLPQELRRLLFNKVYKFFARFNNQVTLVIKERDGLNRNQLFEAAEAHLGTLVDPSTKRFLAVLPKGEKKIKFSNERDEEITDIFNGLQVKWKMVRKKKERPKSEVVTLLSLELRFHKKHKDKVFDEYLPRILKEWKAMNKKKKKLKLFTLRLDGCSWESVNFDHSATFDTLALDLDMKQGIIDDLDRFVKRKKLYRRVGKAWKRGYLLYGPPGTGKSTLVAAMANYLGFDVYDLELTAVRSDSDLRRLLIRTVNRSIIVVEDIDRSLSLEGTDRQRVAPPPPPRANAPYPVNRDLGASFSYSVSLSFQILNNCLWTRISSECALTPFHSSIEFQITLSGLLNFNDGLWSSCGDERIIVFTTNHKDRLDPAMLRPGRMDLHIHMSYCTPTGFRILASNYLEITDHPLFSQIEELIEIMKVTPAEVGELLLRDDDPEIAVRALIEFLLEKKENEEIIADIGPSKVEILPEAEGEEGESGNYET